MTKTAGKSLVFLVAAALILAGIPSFTFGSFYIVKDAFAPKKTEQNSQLTGFLVFERQNQQPLQIVKVRESAGDLWTVSFAPILDATVKVQVVELFFPQIRLAVVDRPTGLLEIKISQKAFLDAYGSMIPMRGRVVGKLSASMPILAVLLIILVGRARRLSASKISLRNFFASSSALNIPLTLRC
ncbi:MAG: hypothetical protein HY397_01555 [Candidatus Doudnabacteria bacterium]|nr:hypothetical protein [Candidatus Doudnabacteria bacterium]